MSTCSPPASPRNSPSSPVCTSSCSSSTRCCATARLGSRPLRPPQPLDTQDNCSLVEAFREGLRELGYVEGQNIAIEWRFAEGQPERLSGFAAELVELQPDVLVVTGSQAI